jgi:hypothetical protein
MGFLTKAIGGIFGSDSNKEAVQEQQFKGFNYLKDNEIVNQSQDMSGQAMGLISGLLGLGGDQAAADKAFEQFKDSSGYQFRMDEGMGAITNSRAARGILNSGATSKELMKYGQNLASDEFSNYLGQVGGVVGQGLTSAYTTGGAAQAGGMAAAGTERQSQEDAASGFGGLVSTGLSVASSIFGF